MLPDDKKKTDIHENIFSADNKDVKPSLIHLLDEPKGLTIAKVCHWAVIKSRGGIEYNFYASVQPHRCAY